MISPNHSHESNFLSVSRFAQKMQSFQPENVIIPLATIRTQHVVIRHFQLSTHFPLFNPSFPLPFAPNDLNLFPSEASKQWTRNQQLPTPRRLLRRRTRKQLQEVRPKSSTHRPRCQCRSRHSNRSVPSDPRFSIGCSGVHRPTATGDHHRAEHQDGSVLRLVPGVLSALSGETLVFRVCDWMMLTGETGD